MAKDYEIKEEAKKEIKEVKVQEEPKKIPPHSLQK